MRKKDILGNYVKSPGVLYDHAIRKLDGEDEAYIALITFLPGSKELRKELNGEQVCLAGPGYKWLMYLPINECWCITAFYSPDEKLLEWYFDITLGNFVDEAGMPCIDDIFLDLVVLPDGQTITLDADELQSALDKSEISAADYDHAYKVHDEIKNSKWSDVGFLTELSGKLLLEFAVGDIPGRETFAKIEPLDKGWSGDKKYKVETTDGKRLLLRISDIEERKRKEAEFGMLQRAATIGVLLSAPVSFGVCANGKKVYQLLTWIEGEDLEEALPKLPEAQRYALGIKAGELLGKIHALPASDCAEPWDVRFWRKASGRIDFYHASSAQSESGDKLVRYLQSKRDWLRDRPQVFNHGDFGVSNLILAPDGQVGVVDFNYFNSDHGDPWWEFDSVPWGAEPCAHFYTGFIKGYFGGEPPRAFFEMLSYYFAYGALAALCDTSIGEQGEPEDGRKTVENTLRWFDGMENPVPSWYLGKR